MTKTFEQRPYQQKIISKADKHLKDGYKSILVVSPPGSGKTVMGWTITKNALNQSGEIFGCDPSDVGIAWMAMRRNLLAQAAEENNVMVGCPNTHFISMFEDDFTDHPIMKYKKRILVCDETHHIACDSATSVVNALNPDFILGLSATPYRTDKVKLCFETTLQDAGFHCLIQDGYLSKFDQWIIDSWNPEVVADTYLREIDKWKKSIMYFLTFEECMKCFNILQVAGVRCEIVTGSTDRFRQIDELASGKLQLLINMHVLTEGVDIPDLNTVFVRDSDNKGPTIQMAGRCLRKHPSKQAANIVQSVDTRFPFTKVASARHQYLMQDGEWRIIGNSEMIDIMTSRMLKRLTENKVSDDAQNDLMWLQRKAGFGRRHRRGSNIL